MFALFSPVNRNSLRGDTLFATSCEWGEQFVHRLWANEGSGWQVVPNNPQYLSEYREILEALKGNTREKPLSVLGMK